MSASHLGTLHLPRQLISQFPIFSNQNLMKAGTRNMFTNLNYTPTNISYTYLWV